jgi:hypothetical protein
MESQESRQVAPLEQRVGMNADSAQIADAMVAIWHEIGQALGPIVGPRGVAALYRRSLNLTATRHAWIGPAALPQEAEMDLGELKTILIAQSGAEAHAGGMALLQTFHQLLSSLVGPLLTERLLRTVWADSSSGPSAQDSQT